MKECRLESEEYKLIDALVNEGWERYQLRAVVPI